MTAEKRRARRNTTAQAVPTLPSGVGGAFWRQVDRGDGAGCWIWKGRRLRGRDRTPTYGYTRVGGRRILAHRTAWALAYGALADGVLVLHSCDNPACVRPSHLFLGTQIENLRDMATKCRKGRLTREQVAEIRRRRIAGEKIVPLAAEFGVDPAHVYLVSTGGRRPYLDGPRATQRRQRAQVLPILALRATGMSWREVARARGLTLGQLWATVCPQPSRRPDQFVAQNDPTVFGSIAPLQAGPVPDLDLEAVAAFARRHGWFRPAA